ncbi:MAG: host-nuclease inhibitor Gam family protein [Ignavibacteriaceae bacterium]|nr:host-nuclease inhibitor Gam family protein [Ignavibacteriaceae bacterium]
MEMNFLEELLQEVEQKEVERDEAYFDLLLLQIKQINNQISYNFSQAEKECSMINSFVLHKNAQLQERIKWLELKLQSFILDKKEKTITLPNGTLKMHKKPDRVEIGDLELFLKKAKPEMLTIIPEQVKPDLNKIKNYIKSKPVPPGIKVIEGKEEFSYKLREESEEENTNGRTKEAGIRTEQASKLRVVV